MFQQADLIKQLQEQHFEQYMSQVYERQAQSQAEALEASGRDEKESDSDSEAGPKPAASYMQQGTIIVFKKYCLKITVSIN